MADAEVIARRCFLAREHDVAESLDQQVGCDGLLPLGFVMP
jgi:hypothetical protein